MNLTTDQLERIKTLKEQLPSDWATQFLKVCEDDFKKRFTRQTPYNILNGCKDHHFGWKILEGIAKRHQEKIQKVAS